jgi:hypothetical protein
MLVLLASTLIACRFSFWAYRDDSRPWKYFSEFRDAVKGSPRIQACSVSQGDYGRIREPCGGSYVIQLFIYPSEVRPQSRALSLPAVHPNTRLALRSISLQPSSKVAVMAYHTHIIAAHAMMRAAERFYDRGIPDATGRLKTQAVEHQIHTIRVAGIDDCSFRVSYAAADVGGEF